jgi:hypothetical protein
MTHRIPILCLCFFLVLLAGLNFAASLPAFAQSEEEEAELNIGEILLGEEEEEDNKPINQYDEKYKPEGPASKDDKKDKNFTAVNGFTLHFVRDLNVGADEAVLRISQPVSVNGCVDITMEPPVVEQRGAAISITVKQPKIVLNKKPQYSTHGCRMKMTGANADVKLNRADIMENGVKQIAFKVSGAPDTYMVDVTHNRLTLIPKTSYMFKPNIGMGMPDPMTYWFYPVNTIVLIAPRATQDVTEEITKLAHRNQMVGLEDTLIGFEQPPARENKLYFVDQTGKTAKQIDTEGTVFLGQVPQLTAYRGAQGTYEKETGIDVLAHRPGTLE